MTKEFEINLIAGEISNFKKRFSNYEITDNITLSPLTRQKLKKIADHFQYAVIGMCSD